MEHAFLITAYKNFDLLFRTAKMYAEIGDVYIHIDVKSKLSADDRQKLNSISGVEVFTEYKIYWGSYYHILAVIFLIKKARNKKEYDFYHVITGDTFLCAKREDFKSFFEKNADKNFAEVIPIDERIKVRYEYYYFTHLYDGASAAGKKKTARILKLQQKLKLKQKRSFAYRGYFYCHLNGEFINYLLEYIESDKKYLKSLKGCFIPEEFFFQNALMNSKFKDSDVNDHLIYNVWLGTKGSPEELTEKDFNDIISSGKPFCRKVGRSGEELINKLEKYVLE